MMLGNPFDAPNRMCPLPTPIANILIICSCFGGHQCFKHELDFCNKRYPDGKCYLKLGHGDPFDERVDGRAGLEEWYRRREGNPEAVQELSAFIREGVSG